VKKSLPQEIKLSLDLKDGIIENPILQTSDGINISSAYAIRTNGNSLILKKGIFSPCKACDNKKSKLSWRVKANRIIYDENNQNIIYEDARFELFGIPVLYVPIATHPTEKVKRKSGFLTPTLGSSGDLGAVIRIPYFFNLSPHYDLTVTPWVVTKGAAIVEGEWRQRFKRGGINFSGIIASPNDQFKSRTVNINDDWKSNN
jgi:LPS-assembly protein